VDKNMKSATVKLISSTNQHTVLSNKCNTDN